MMSNTKNFFRASAEDFKKIPGSPVAYWVSERFRGIFKTGLPLGRVADVRHGMSTGKNSAVLRRWYEVSVADSKYNAKSHVEASVSGAKWFPYNKGGDFRRWYGNGDFLIRYDTVGLSAMESFTGFRHDGRERYFQEGVTWTFISSTSFAARYSPKGYLFDVSGSSLFVDNPRFELGFLCSNLAYHILKALNPTINFQVGNLKSLPIIEDGREHNEEKVSNLVDDIILFCKVDWDSYETSWDFKVNPLVEKGCNLVNPVNPVKNLSALYSELRQQWADNTTEMRRLETENNRIFIEAYGLQDELTPDVPWNEITLTCNPWYRYGVKIEGNSGQELGVGAEMPMDEALEARLKSDTVKELISYAVGCMMGRYSLSKPGLILANQGEVVSDKWLVISLGGGKNDTMLLKEEVVDYVSKELQRIDCLAKSNGSCRCGVRDSESIAERGAICSVGSASPGSSVCSIEYSGGAGTKYNKGLCEFSDDGERFLLRNGNSNIDLPTSELCNAIASGNGDELVRRGWKDAEFIDWKALHISLTTPHSPLPTNHFPLTTNHFSPDADGIIPILDDDSFADDIVTQFHRFLRAAFGERNFNENLNFIEDALGKDIRAYFVKDFYPEHLMRYQKRPIYWLFSSPKGTFSALVYMHRYNSGTVGQVLGYLRSHITKIEARVDAADRTTADAAATQGMKSRAIKERAKLVRQLKELEDYEREIMHPLASKRIEIDLDDGVKVNYPKFGEALRKIPGMKKED